MNVAEEEEYEDVSVCARYRKYPQWNSVLETEFLDDLVRCYPNTSGLDLDLYFESDPEDGGGQRRPLLQTPTWSLSLIEGDRLSPIKPVIIPIVQSSKKKRRRSGHLIERSKINSSKKGRLVKTSNYYNHKDWSELYLLQNLSGEESRNQYSSTDSSTDLSNDVIFENIYAEDNADFNDFDMEDEDVSEQTEETTSKAPVRDAIRKQIEESKDRRLLKFRHEKDTWKKYNHPAKESLMELPVINRQNAIKSCSVVTLLDQHLYNTSRKHFEQTKFWKRKQKPERKKRVYLYEQKPSKDPIVEAQRLKCLYQKIYDDKKRFNYEILQVENKELKEENVLLKEQIQRLMLGDRKKLCRRIPGSCSDYTVSDSEGSLSDPESLIGRRKNGE